MIDNHFTLSVNYDITIDFICSTDYSELNKLLNPPKI